MEVLDFTPTILKAKVLPWEPITIMPLGDIQVGAQGCDLPRLQRHIEAGLRAGAYFFGMGDYTDFLSPSNRLRLKQAALYDTAAGLIDEWHQKHIDDLVKVLAPTKGRWVGMLEGHHFHEFQDGTTSDMRLASILEAPFLGTCAMVRLNFRDVDHHRSVSAHIWGHHGEGSGATLASPLNKLERISGFIDADVFFMGHYHRCGVTMSDKLYVTGSQRPRLTSRTRALVATGSFLRGYMQGNGGARPQGSYIEKALLSPASLGSTMVTIAPVHGDDGDDIRLVTHTSS